jgi:hypothetical protein
MAGSARSETVETLESGDRVMTVDATTRQTRIHAPEVEIAPADSDLAGEPGRLGGELLLGNEAIALDD